MKNSALLIFAIVAGLAGLGAAIFYSTKKASASLEASVDKAAAGTENVNKLAGQISRIMELAGIEAD